MIERSARAWLSIVVVQALGSIWIAYSNQTSKSHFVAHSPVLSRTHALPLALLCILRIVVIFEFQSIPLHVAHILLSLATAIHTLSEVFYFGSMTYGVVTVTEVTLNGFSAVLLTALIFFKISQEPQPERRRPKRLTAKHLMEGNLLTPDEDDELVKAYKKFK
ncbi:unnamed protein product [Caenorhabditis bovis]|uniref:Uncharacterized protein n=1 Tax=Caenorhabditis bovis TaxID=2654633 RepID=A0A8S1EGW5_9PELO|nr:unnamed protein product [Caenorhabditis bovis]